MHKIFLSLRYLRKKRIAFFAITAVMLSVALLVLVTSLFHGVINAFEKSVAQTEGDIILDIPFHLQDLDALSSHLEQSNLIDLAIPRHEAGGLLYMGKGQVRGVRFIGTDLARITQTPSFKNGLLQKPQEQKDFSLTQKQIETFNTYWKKRFRRDSTEKDLPIPAIIGIGVLGEPDEITDEYDTATISQQLDDLKNPFVMISARTSSESGQRETKKVTRLCWPIDALQMGWYLIDSNTVMVPVEHLYDIKPPTSFDFRIYASKSQDLNVVANELHTTWMDYATQTLGMPQDKAKWANISLMNDVSNAQLIVGEYRKQLFMIQIILGFIGSVASLLIFVILYMMVMSKKRDIGIIRSLGATKSSIGNIFINFGLGIGCTGALLGVFLGIWITSNIREIELWLSKLLGFKIWKSSSYKFIIPNELASWESIFWIPLAGVILAVLGALLPAFLAARSQPVNSLRYE